MRWMAGWYNIIRHNADGLLVMHHGEVVFEHLVDGIPVWKTHSLNSAAKVFTGCVAAILADQGKLNWDIPLDGHVHELKGTGADCDAKTCAMRLTKPNIVMLHML